jgi:hypothetical protein
MKRAVFSILLCLIIVPLMITSHAYAGNPDRGVVNGQTGGAGEAARPAESLEVQLARYQASDLYREHLRMIREAGAPTSTGSAVVNFDAAPAPCNFASTVALRGMYQGAFFHGAR